jgi:hypothetical protein
LLICSRFYMQSNRRKKKRKEHQLCPILSLQQVSRPILSAGSGNPNLGNLMTPNQTA